MDGSTDAGNKEQELVFVTFCYRDVKALEIRSHTRYLSIVNPATTNSEGLVSCLQGAFAKQFDVDIFQKDSVLNSDKPVLVCGGTDGASVNVGIHNGMKARMQETLPWLY